MSFGHAMFARVEIDWAALGLTGSLFDEFVEQVLRTIQSLTLDPGEPPRTGAALREYLTRWLWSPAMVASPAGGP
jgi:hypothetical protein